MASETTSQNLKPVPKPVDAAGVHQLYLAGEWTASAEVVEVLSPYDRRVVGRVALATPEQLEQAITASVRAFVLTRKLAGYERQRALAFVARGLAERVEEFAQCISAEAGKPIRTARAEVERAAFCFQYAAEQSTRLIGEVLPLDALPVGANRVGILRRVPLGPVAAITPFNFPLNLVAHKMAPAMAAGCSIVLKPATQTPFSALLLAQLVADSGYPREAVSVLPMTNQTAAPLVEDERFKLFTFTGSSAVGWAMKSRAGKKKVALELGGNAGCIVHSDADLDKAAARSVAGGFAFAGQSCISVQRILVQKSVYAAFLEKLASAVAKLVVGNPAGEATEVGPMIRPEDAARAEEWIAEAVAGGAKVVCGGHRHGSVVEPTVLTGTRESQKVNCQEVFAPVVTVEPYDDFEEALQRVNRSPYGLQAGVFTSDMGRILRAYEELEVGGVIAGDVPTFRMDQMPYGGVKDSGQGREGIAYAIEEMTEPKLLVLG
jgi:acyl-CoA reductase-like NAD-dependent aldehyde dehydrogenase